MKSKILKRELGPKILSKLKRRTFLEVKINALFDSSHITQSWLRIIVYKFSVTGPKEITSLLASRKK